jgi:hypothetical protein
VRVVGLRWACCFVSLSRALPFARNIDGRSRSLERPSETVNSGNNAAPTTADPFKIKTKKKNNFRFFITQTKLHFFFELVSISSIHNDPGKKFYFSKFKFRAPLFFF